VSGAVFELRVLEDVLRPGESRALDAANRVVYTVEGRLTISTDDAATTIGENEAWHGVTARRVSAGDTLVRAWRWELRDVSIASGSTDGLKLARPIRLDQAARYLMRCDRVDFPPGGIAYTHVHQGPGIRMLLHGTFRVETAGHVLHLRPGEPWFERGPDPVSAVGSESEDTSFVRVMILPQELQGRSSIRYVNAEDQAKPKSQRYTIFVDAPIDL
jgi:quercetin dioxygenase-like cupin family protein